MIETSMAPNDANVNYQHMPEQDFRVGIAENLLIVALLNYRRAVTGQIKPGDPFPKALNDLSEIERNHYGGLVRAAVHFIWGGR